MDLNLIGIGIGGSLITALTAWFKNASADGKIEAYEFRYLVPNLLTGVLSGLVAGIPGIPAGLGVGIAALGPVVTLNLAKGIARHGGGTREALAVAKGVLAHLLADLKNPEARKEMAPEAGK